PRSPRVEDEGIPCSPALRFPAPFLVSAGKFPVRAGREVFAGIHWIFGLFRANKKSASPAPFLGFPCIFPCSQGKRTFWSVGLHHPDIQLPELVRAKPPTAPRPSSDLRRADSSGTAHFCRLSSPHVVLPVAPARSSPPEIAEQVAAAEASDF